jgi:hypothetical protein
MSKCNASLRAQGEAVDFVLENYHTEDFHKTLTEEDNRHAVEFPRHSAMLSNLRNTVNYLLHYLDYTDNEGFWLSEDEIGHIKGILNSARRMFKKRGFVFIGEEKRDATTQVINDENAYNTVGKYIVPSTPLLERAQKTWGKNSGELIFLVQSFDFHSKTLGLEIRSRQQGVSTIGFQKIYGVKPSEIKTVLTALPPAEATAE